MTDVSEETGMLTVLGPGAADALASHASGLRLESSDLEGMAEGDLFALDVGGVEPLVVVRTGDVSVPAWDLVAGRADVDALERALGGAGVAHIGSGVWESLRIEAGRPAFGADLTDQVIPISPVQPAIEEIVIQMQEEALFGVQTPAEALEWGAAEAQAALDEFWADKE